jgi:hypothetical protein
LEFGNSGHCHCDKLSSDSFSCRHERTFHGSTFNVYAANGASFDYGGQRADGRGNRWIYFGPLNAGNTLLAWNGARLTDGGTWSNASDKNRKTDFKEVNAQEILERLTALPVRQWRYTNENPTVKHIGPTAQDFKAAFGLGDDDKSIGTVDADGVALTAIQALSRKIEEERALNQELSRRLAELENLIFKSKTNNNQSHRKGRL